MVSHLSPLSSKEKLVKPFCKGCYLYTRILAQGKPWFANATTFSSKTEICSENVSRPGWPVDATTESTGSLILKDTRLKMKQITEMIASIIYNDFDNPV